MDEKVNTQLQFIFKVAREKKEKNSIGVEGEIESNGDGTIEMEVKKTGYTTLLNTEFGLSLPLSSLVEFKGKSTSLTPH